jgi:hypothetical protein
VTLGDLGRAEEDAALLVARIRSAWAARRACRIRAGRVTAGGRVVWRDLVPVPPSGPFARLASAADRL